MNKVYWGWYKCIGDDATNEAVWFEAEVKVNIGVWGTQRFKGLLHLIRELELDK